MICETCGYWAREVDWLSEHHPNCPELYKDGTRELPTDPAGRLIATGFLDPTFTPTEMPPDPPGENIDPDTPDPYWRGQIGA